MEPTQKRFSVWEPPDNGTKWPECFDAITVRQEVSRYVKPKEVRRWLDEYYGYPYQRASDYLYGAIVHQENNEHEAVVMFDLARAYHHVSLITSRVIGSSQYGYAVGEVELFSENQVGVVNTGDYLTYFCVQQDFSPVEGELLGAMIGSFRDYLRK